ncbi:hypothetical protein EWM64_g814 [Hericium alpestre]|uniref:ATP-dependent DNA helicase RecQ zinc-binding domain-containing protein n=1 Tax=Hericium alpestre TaxID=135208 RepID=A0A4Z0AC41_9AGAM|nr:hypothetical protein EWM64_g814 [Hericium alpestre]
MQDTIKRPEEPAEMVLPQNVFSTILIKFAERLDICRHVAVCRYFGESIDTTNPEVAKSYCDKMCDVCKYPEKVQKRKQALSSQESAGLFMARIQREMAEDDDDSYPVPQVQPPRSHRTDENSVAGPSRQGPPAFQNQASSKSKSKVEDWPQLPTMPLAARNNYVGPGLLRSRVPGLKRTGSATSAGSGDSDNAKRPKIDYSLASGSVTRRPQGPTPFKVPFKVPFKAAPTAERIRSPEDPDQTEEADVVEDPENNVALPSSQPRTQPSEQGYNSANSSLLSSPVKLPDDNIHLDVSFSQKIPVNKRNETFTSIRKALHKATMQHSDSEDVWRRVKMASSSIDTRNGVVSAVAQELEFSVHSMSSTEKGYQTRSRATIAAAKAMAKMEAWEAAGDEEFEEAQEVVAVFKRLCKSSKSHGKSRAE